MGGEGWEGLPPPPIGTLQYGSGKDGKERRARGTLGLRLPGTSFFPL